MNIRIRAWDKSWKRMLYSPESYFTVFFNKQNYLVGENYDIHGDEQILDIMLSTGLRDYNGKEIYEGDVISDLHFKWVVVYQKDMFIGRLVSHNNHEVADERISKILASRERAGMPVSVIGHIYNGEII